MPGLTDTYAFAKIDAAASGNNTVIAAVASQKIHVFRLWLVVRAAVDIRVRDGASTDLTGPLPLAAISTVFLDLSPEPWFVTSVGNALVLNLSAAIQVSGAVYYKQG